MSAATARQADHAGPRRIIVAVTNRGILAVCRHEGLVRKHFGYLFSCFACSFFAGLRKSRQGASQGTRNIFTPFPEVP